MKTLQSVEEFETLKNNGIHIFLFTADWCPDCRFIEPFMPEITDTYKDFTFVSIDRDQFIDLCKELEIFGIPSFVAYKDGKELGRFVGKKRKTKEEIDRKSTRLNSSHR
mgnify:CR=1 FL=1